MNHIYGQPVDNKRRELGAMLLTAKRDIAATMGEEQLSMADRLAKLSAKCRDRTTCHINVSRFFACGQEQVFARLSFTHSRNSSANMSNKHIHAIEQWTTTLTRAATRETYHD